MITEKTSVNNKVVCAPYLGGKGLQAQVTSGFATVKQKDNLVGLKTLLDAHVVIGNHTFLIPKNSTLFFKEETLYLNSIYHAPMVNPLLNEPCVIAEFSHAVMVQMPEAK